MPLLTIAFPVFDPVAISIGPIAIRWYALAYIGGIVLGWIYARSLVKKERLWGGPAPITLVQLDDFILWVTIGIIVGGRTPPTSSSTRRKYCSCGMAACRSTAASSAASRR
jgi:phosphatidylglycerol:prolipoprotein diacylglycerol transferase